MLGIWGLDPFLKKLEPFIVEGKRMERVVKSEVRFFLCVAKLWELLDAIKWPFTYSTKMICLWVFNRACLSVCRLSQAIRKSSLSVTLTLNNYTMLSDGFADKTILNSLIASGNFTSFICSQCWWKKKKKKRNMEGKGGWTRGEGNKKGKHRKMT